MTTNITLKRTKDLEPIEHILVLEITNQTNSPTANLAPLYAYALLLNAVAHTATLGNLEPAQIGYDNINNFVDNMVTQLEDFINKHIGAPTNEANSQNNSIH